MLRRCSHPKKEEVRHPASAPPVFFQNSPHPVTSLEKGQVLWSLVFMKVLGGPNNKQCSIASSPAMSLHGTTAESTCAMWPCAGSSYSYIYSKYLSTVRRESMRLLEIGMGCSVHGGVNGLNTLLVRPASLSLPRPSPATQAPNGLHSGAPGAVRKAPRAAESPPCKEGRQGPWL